MLVMAMQNLGLIGMMTVPWPLNLQGLFSICQFLLLDIDSYGFTCIAGSCKRGGFHGFSVIFQFLKASAAPARSFFQRTGAKFNFLLHLHTYIIIHISYILYIT
jgi:hypothetical protein